MQDLTYSCCQCSYYSNYACLHTPRIKSFVIQACVPCPVSQTCSICIIKHNIAYKSCLRVAVSPWSSISHWFVLFFSLIKEIYGTRYNDYNGGWPSARLFGWSAADWSRPATNKCISSERTSLVFCWKFSLDYKGLQPGMAAQSIGPNK
jgi:hypothetical protein